MMWSIALVLFAPILGSVVLHTSSWGQSSPRTVVKLATAAGLLGTLLVFLLQTSQQVIPFWSRFGLGSDGFSNVLLVLYAFFFFMLVVLCPMSLSYKQETTLILSVELGVFLVLLSTHLWTYMLGCVVIVLPLYFKLRSRPQLQRESRHYLWYQLAGLGLIGLGFLSLYGDVPPQWKQNFFSIPFLVQHIQQVKVSFVTTVLFAVGVLFRLGVWPFHVPLVVMFQRARYGGLIAYLFGHILVTSMLKFGGILLTHILQPVLVVVLAILLVNALYFSLTSLVQQHLRRLMAYQFFSFLALGMTLFVTPTSRHFLDCKVEVVTLSLVFGGLMSTLWLVESHIDVDNISQYQGIAKHTPSLAAFFLIFILTAMGFPGTIGYLAEELVLQNRFHHATWEGFFSLFVIGLNAWVLFRCYARLFLGPVSSAFQFGIPLNFREKLALLCIVVFIVFNGVVPDVLFRIR